MSVLNENQLLGASGAGEYEIKQSLRFNDNDTASLSRTPSVAGNQKTWTLSCWVKRGDLANQGTIFEAATSGAVNTIFYLYGTTLYLTGSTSTYDFVLSQVFRDASAWYHLMIAMDTTQSTASNRTKIYINGSIVTAFATETYPSLNLNTTVNSTIAHSLGKRAYDTSLPWDGYMAEVNFIDGQALTPDSFGETGDYGEWKPIEYAGTYGTNGFYLPFEQDYTVEGFSTVTYEGNSSTNHYVGGTGFSPDVVWIKARSSGYNHQFYDSVRGANEVLETDTTNADETRADGLLSFDTDGFSLGSQIRSNNSGQTYVAWNWDMGGTTASNTSGSITSSVRANTAYGQSIVSYTGTGSAATVGHGLASAPTMIIVKNRSVVNPWWVYTATLGAGKQLRLNDTHAEGSDGGVIWNNTAPTSSVFSVNSNTGSNGSGNALIAYCFADVTGYSKFGSYSGNGSNTGPVVTLGFSPAFVMIKRTDAAGNSWRIFDNTRNPTNPVDKIIYANLSNAETTQDNLEFVSDGLNIIGTSTDVNASGGTYIYAAFADTREYAYWYDQSGNNNDWTSEGGLTESDVMLDSPTNNFATLNPLDKGSITVSEGNTKAAYAAAHETILSTFSVSTGKHYFESYINASTSSGNFSGIGTNAGGILNSHVGSTATSWGYELSGDIWNNNISVSGNASLATGDILGIAFDADANTITYYKNNTVQPQTHTGIASGTYSPQLSIFHSGSFIVANFGQDSSFAGNKTPQGNQDANGIGDFYYAPPTGFLALCTANLPEVDVIPSEHFNPVIYSGNSSTQSIAVGFQPDFTWIKNRGYTHNHKLLDSVRGATKELVSNTTDAEITGANGLTSFDSNGFTLGSAGGVNSSSYNYVSWNWKAGGTAVSNTNGTITSQVSANPSAGFSIVSYTGNGTAGATVGHGLSVAPEMIIVKTRDVVGNWYLYNKELPTASYTLKLNTADAQNSTNFTTWNGTDPSSTLITLGSSTRANASSAMIAYCFHSVDGYSKVGSYTGNGSATDGTFVHCGFKPAWVMVKRTNASGNSWRIFDKSRSPDNAVDKIIHANLSNAETTQDNFDFVSNGLKLRGTSTDVNANGGTYIFLAFAESPFKNTNAR